MILDSDRWWDRCILVGNKMLQRFFFSRSSRFFRKEGSICVSWLTPMFRDINPGRHDVLRKDAAAVGGPSKPQNTQHGSGAEYSSPAK